MSGGKAGTRTEAVRRDFEEALDRLLDGKPNDKKLRELAAAKKLRITVASVALEAGRSRTLIGSDGCRFPDIRQRVIEASRGENQPVTTVTRLVSSLRATNAELRGEIKALRSQQALMLVRIIEAERTAAQATEALQGKSSGSGEPKVVEIRSFPGRRRR